MIMYMRTNGKKIIRSILPTLRPPDDPPSAHAYFDFNVPLYVEVPVLAPDSVNSDIFPFPVALRSHTKVILDILPWVDCPLSMTP